MKIALRNKLFKSKINKLSLLVLLLFLGQKSFGQTPQKNSNQAVPQGPLKTLHIEHADRVGQIRGADSVLFIIMAGNVALHQEGTFFTTDSLIRNSVTQLIEAFGHVHIKDAQGTNTYSDYLRYTALDKKAYLSGNVVMRDPSIKLTTPDLDYDMSMRVATYTKGGTVLNGSTVLNSQSGTYYAQTHDAQFNTNVRLVDPKYKINTETLLYNTESKIATFTVPTEITDGKNKRIIP